MLGRSREPRAVGHGIGVRLTEPPHEVRPCKVGKDQSLPNYERCAVHHRHLRMLVADNLAEFPPETGHLVEVAVRHQSHKRHECGLALHHGQGGHPSIILPLLSQQGIEVGVLTL